MSPGKISSVPVAEPVLLGNAAANGLGSGEILNVVSNTGRSVRASGFGRWMDL